MADSAYIAEYKEIIRAWRDEMNKRGGEEHMPLWPDFRDTAEVWGLDKARELEAWQAPVAKTNVVSVYKKPSRTTVTPGEKTIDVPYAQRRYTRKSPSVTASVDKGPKGKEIDWSHKRQSVVVMPSKKQDVIVVPDDDVSFSADSTPAKDPLDIVIEQVLDPTPPISPMENGVNVAKAPEPPVEPVKPTNRIIENVKRKLDYGNQEFDHIKGKLRKKPRVLEDHMMCWNQRITDPNPPIYVQPAARLDPIDDAIGIYPDVPPTMERMPMDDSIDGRIFVLNKISSIIHQLEKLQRDLDHGY